MFILRGILCVESQEKVPIYLLLRGAGYGKNIAEFYGVPTDPVQKQLVRLEADGVIISPLIGKVRNYELNPRHPFVESLTQLLKVGGGSVSSRATESVAGPAHATAAGG